MLASISTGVMRPSLVNALVDSFLDTKQNEMRRQLDLVLETLFRDLRAQIKELLVSTPDANNAASHATSFPRSSSPTPTSDQMPRVGQSIDKESRVRQIHLPFVEESEEDIAQKKLKACRASSGTGSWSKSTRKRRRRPSEMDPSVVPTGADTQPPGISKCAKQSSYVCPSPGCSKAFPKLFNLKRHQLTHEPGQKPFQCTWPGCQHSSTDRSNVLAHIRNRHFKRSVKEGEQQRQAEWDPKLYLKVNLDQG